MRHFHPTYLITVPLYSVFVPPSHIIVTIWYNVIIFYCYCEFRYNEYRPKREKEMNSHQIFCLFHIIEESSRKIISPLMIGFICLWSSIHLVNAKKGGWSSFSLSPQFSQRDLGLFLGFAGTQTRTLSSVLLRPSPQCASNLLAICSS